MTMNESVHARLISVYSNNCFAGHAEGLDVIICSNFFVFSIRPYYLQRKVLQHLKNCSISVN